MIATELWSISSASHRRYRRCCPVSASNRPGQRRFGPFRASRSLDAGLLEIDQPLEVVAGGYRRHRKVRACLANGADQLDTHLCDGRKWVPDSGARPGDAPVAPLLAVGQGLVARALPPNLVAKAILFQPGFTPLGRIAPVGIDIPARIDRVEDLVEVLAVVHAGRVGHDLADELVPPVDVDRELVAEVALPVLLGPGRVNSFCRRLAGFQSAGSAPWSSSAFWPRLLCCFGFTVAPRFRSFSEGAFSARGFSGDERKSALVSRL